MFGDTLLESSPASGKRKRWPIATAFTVEAIIAAIVVIIPLLSTGVIPVSARVPLFTRLNPVVVQSVPLMPVTQRSSGADGIPSRAVMIMANNNRNAIHYGQPEITTTDWRDAPPSYVGPGESHNPIGDLIGAGPATTNVKPGPRRIVSQLTEAQLLNKVEPIYPRIAQVTGIQGQVRLRAIIARDGSIQSLNAINGNPLLIRAAMDAVSQWRYRPYVLNGETVEVETFITVNFRKDVH
ncbi:MAG TPA: energy transducer TonB [Candidatus Angelobacter sp.]|jgi:protein TonB